MDQLEMGEQQGVAGLQQQVAQLSNALQQSEIALQQQCQQTQAMRVKALDAIRVKLAFFANISHEIRTPMNAIMGFTQLMHETDITQQQSYYLQQIKGGGDTLMRLIDALLDLSRLESGDVVLARAPFVLRELLQGVSSRFLPEAESRGLLFDIDLDASVPDQWVGDSHRIEQIISHLLENAIKFTEQGSVKLTVGFTALDGSESVDGNRDGVLELSVQDSGIGMDSALRARLFQPFSLGDDSLTRRQGGSGMGLSICHHLLALMGGSITASSELGQGSLFHVTMPLPFAALSLEALIGHRILVVDDNETNRQIANEILSDWGLIVLEAADGAQAIQCLEQQPCDLVLMDLLMPVMGGLEATQAIRKMTQFASLPIVAMTGSSSEDDRLQCLAAGMDDVLGKPIDFDALPQQLIAWLHGDGQAAIAPPSANTSVREHGLPSLLPAIEDADRDHALRALGDKVALYQQLLAHFPREYAHAPAEIEAAMEQHDFATAQRVAHTLKSSAAALGARLLRDSAAQLEQLFCAGERPSAEALQAMEQRCAALVQVALDQQDVDEVTSEPSEHTLSRAALIGQIAQLSTVLQHGEERAIAMLDEIWPQLKKMDQAGAEGVRVLVDGFDFVAAATLLQQMISNMPPEEE